MNLYELRQKVFFMFFKAIKDNIYSYKKYNQNLKHWYVLYTKFTENL